MVICSQGACHCLPEQNLIKKEQARPAAELCSHLRLNVSITASHGIAFILEAQVAVALTHNYIHWSQHSKAGTYGTVLKLFLFVVYLFPQNSHSHPCPTDGAHAARQLPRALCQHKATLFDVFHQIRVPKFFVGARDERQSMAKPGGSSQQYAIHFHTCYGSYGVSRMLLAHAEFLKPLPATF